MFLLWRLGCRKPGLRLKPHNASPTKKSSFTHVSTTVPQLIETGTLYAIDQEHNTWHSR